MYTVIQLYFCTVSSLLFSSFLCVCRVQVIVPSTYLQNPPTDPSLPSEPVTVSLRVNILNIDKIDTVNMMFALTMEVYFEWKDHRLKYKNLREGLGQNQLTPEVLT